MSNTLLTSTVILNETLRILTNNNGFTRNVDRQYDDRFAESGAKQGQAGKPGTSLQVRLPVKHVVNTGAALNINDVIEETVTINCATQKHIDFTFTSEDLTMTISDFAKRFLKTGAAKLASTIDYDGLSLFKDIYQLVGTPGTTPATSLIYLQAAQKLDEMAAPFDDERYACINPAAQASIVDALKGLFQSSEKISQQYSKGRMGQALGLKFGVDQNVNQHTTGSRAGTILVDGAPTEGSNTIHVDGLTGATDTFTDGDVFTVADVYAINPDNGESTGALQQFVVTADATAASNEVDLTVSPTLHSTGARKTISALPANDAAVTVVGTASTAYPQNIVHHKEAFTLVTADLQMPKGVDFAARDRLDNMSMRIVRDFDIVNDRFPCRIDIFYGWTTLRPELACRIIG